jgi:CRP/FNR family cyclic AMP-dependent transcriptional regulator
MNDMFELNFTVPAPKPVSEVDYDVSGALEFIASAGSLMNVAPGQTIFIEYEKSNPFLLQRDKMYFLLEGEVDLTVHKKLVGVARQGEILGEMALITGMPRTATATAVKPCKLLALTKDQLQKALETAPEFGLFLMNIMISRLRNTIKLLSARGALSKAEGMKDAAIFDKKLLEKLEKELDSSALMRFPEGKIILQEGQSGMLMYVVLEGSVNISIKHNVVGEIGSGGMFGEMALIAPDERVASASANTDCVLLAINRAVFLKLVRANPKFAVSLLGAVGNRARYIASLLA